MLPPAVCLSKLAVRAGIRPSKMRAAESPSAFMFHLPPTRRPLATQSREGLWWIR